MSNDWYHIDAASGVITLRIHAQPGARRSAIAGLHGDALKVKIAGQAVEGQANAALLRFLAEAFDVPLRDVTLRHGATSRSKIVEIHGSTRDPLRLLDKVRQV